MRRKINLVRLSKNEIELVKGGYVWKGDDKICCCGCGCYGPSSTRDNMNANYEDGLHSPIQ
jgi:hypothetical protein